MRVGMYIVRAHVIYILPTLMLHSAIRGCRPNGVTFVAAPGTAEFANKKQLKPGDIVTFKHRGLMIES